MKSIPFPNTHSADDESHCPADVFFCSQSVGVLQLFSFTLTVIRSTGCKKFKTVQRKLFFARVDMNTLDRALLKALQWQPVKERIIFKVASFVFCVFDGTQPQYLSPRLYVYVPRPVRSSSNKKLFSFLFFFFFLKILCTMET